MTTKANYMQVICPAGECEFVRAERTVTWVTEDGTCGKSVEGYWQCTKCSNRANFTTQEEKEDVGR
jgi:uncharacterized cupin superfamily protein